MAPSGLAVGAIVVDFDGTFCTRDVSDEILLHFVGPLARELDREYELGRIGSRENLSRIGSHLRAPPEDVLAWALENHAVDPAFPSFVEWSRAQGSALVVVSDGIGIHVEPLLRAAGIEGLPVVTNRILPNGERAGPTFDFSSGHPICIECGTCKMLAVTRAREAHGTVAYVGDGRSDRYGALYSDLVFAKGALAGLCREDGIPSIAWESFG